MPNNNTMDKKIVFLLVLILVVVGVYWYSTTADTPETVTPQPAQNSTNTPAEDATPTMTGEGPVRTATSAGGKYVVDRAGLTLYVSAKDESQTQKIKASCDATCEKTWVPYLFDTTDYDAIIAKKDPLLAKINIFKRADGERQYALGSQPLYRYVGDVKLGDTKGPVTGDWKVAMP